MPQEASVRALHMCTRGTHLPGALAHRSTYRGRSSRGPTIYLGWNPMTENPRKRELSLRSFTCYPTAPWPAALRHRDKTRTLLQRVYYVPKKLHHSLLHTSVGDCSLACIYYNEVETSHTASQNPQSSWDMQQCNVSSAGGGGL